MNQHNISFVMKAGTNMVVMTCCHTVPFNVELEEIESFLGRSICHAIRQSSTLSKRDIRSIVVKAMSEADERFGGTSFLLQSDAVAAISL